MSQNTVVAEVAFRSKTITYKLNYSGKTVAGGTVTSSRIPSGLAGQGFRHVMKNFVLKKGFDVQAEIATFGDDPRAFLDMQSRLIQSCLFITREAEPQITMEQFRVPPDAEEAAEEERRREAKKRVEEERQREAEKRAEAERRQEAKKRAEEERKRNAQAAREAAGVCVLCGKPLGMFQKLFRVRKHKECNDFSE